MICVAAAWDCDPIFLGWERPNFDAENNNGTPPNSPKFAVRSDLSTEKTWNTAGVSRERSPEFFPQTEEICDLTDMYPYIELDAEESSEQPKHSPTNPRRSKYNLCHTVKPNCNDHYRSYLMRCTSVSHGTHT